MEAAVQSLLVDQVKEHLNRLSARERVREHIYTYFAPQCNQYDIPEDEFYKHILRQAFKAAAPPQEENRDAENKKGTSVKIFGETIHNLKRLGEVIFDDPGRNEIYFEDATFLKAHADSLEDADTAIEYAKLYQSEKDPEKRYLKICYRLNPALPYRINGERFDNLNELLKAGFENRSVMNLIFQDYVEGKLHIWLNTRNPESFPIIPENKTVVSFLTFLYSTNKDFPFYIEQELFDTPKELATKAQKDLSLWPKIIKNYDNGNLKIWFETLGYEDWIVQTDAAFNTIRQDTKIEKEEKSDAMTQQLLTIMAPESIRPLIALSETEIELFDLPAAQTIELKIELKLKTSGFVKTIIELTSAHDGIWLNKTQAILFSLKGTLQETIILYIDPRRLNKNTEYQTVLQITSPHEKICIPIKVKTVFPVRSFIVHLLKYALFGTLFFGFFRWFLSAITGYSGSLAPRIITTAVSRSLPENYPSFFWVFILMWSLFALSVVFIVKKEKL